MESNAITPQHRIQSDIYDVITQAIKLAHQNHPSLYPEDRPRCLRLGRQQRGTCYCPLSRHDLSRRARI